MLAAVRRVARVCGTDVHIVAVERHTGLALSALAHFCAIANSIVSTRLTIWDSRMLTAGSRVARIRGTDTAVVAIQSRTADALAVLARVVRGALVTIVAVAWDAEVHALAGGFDTGIAGTLVEVVAINICLATSADWFKHTTFARVARVRSADTEVVTDEFLPRDAFVVAAGLNSVANVSV